MQDMKSHGMANHASPARRSSHPSGANLVAGGRRNQTMALGGAGIREFRFNKGGKRI